MRASTARAIGLPANERSKRRDWVEPGGATAAGAPGVSPVEDPVAASAADDALDGEAGLVKLQNHSNSQLRPPKQRPSTASF